MKSKMQDRNRQVECDVYGKPMRSNNLKRHKKTHKDLLSLPDNEIKDELQSREEFKKKREEKIQKIEEIAKENNLTIPDEIIEKRKSNEIDDIRTRCLQNYQLYLEKIEIGKQVATIIENGEIIYESLGRSDKEALILTENISKSIFQTLRYENGKMKLWSYSIYQQKEK